MFKRRGFFLVFVSLAMGGVAAWAANSWVQTRLGPPAGAEDDMERVVAAAMDIPYATKVEARHLRVIAMPQGTVPEQAFREVGDVHGMVATVDILRGEILMRERFSEHAAGSTLAALVQKDMRAITVRVDDVVGVAGFLLPGNRVDVLATRLDQGRRATTRTILTNLKVLAVDQTAATERNDPVIVRAVTLEMTPQQSEELVKAREEGTIQLTLRNPLAPEEVVVQQEAPPPPPPRPAARPAPRPQPSTITIIRGTAVDTERSPT